MQKNLKIIAIRYRDSKNKLYKFGNTIFKENKVNFVLVNIETKKSHCCFEYQNYVKLYHLLKANWMNKLPKIQNEKQIYKACLGEWQHRQKCPKTSFNRRTKMNQLIDAHLMGSMRIASFNGTYENSIIKWVKIFCCINWQ